MAPPDDASPSTAPSSIYLTVRRRYPDLAAFRLRKRVLESFRRVVEREILVQAHQPVLVEAFPSETFVREAQDHWHSIGGTPRVVVVFADGPPEFEDETAPAGYRVVRAPLEHDAPLRQEWAMVCDDERFSVVVSAWEIPGQEDLVDSERLFETVWSFETGPVRSAARMCLALAARTGIAGVAELEVELREDPPAGACARTTSNVLAAVLAEI